MPEGESGGGTAFPDLKLEVAPEQVYSTALLLYYSTTLRLYNFTTLLLHYYKAYYYSTTPLLHYSTTPLLHSSTLDTPFPYRSAIVFNDALGLPPFTFWSHPVPTMFTPCPHPVHTLFAPCSQGSAIVFNDCLDNGDEDGRSLHAGMNRSTDPPTHTVCPPTGPHVCIARSTDPPTQTVCPPTGPHVCRASRSGMAHPETSRLSPACHRRPAAAEPRHDQDGHQRLDPLQANRSHELLRP
jgi:hypothetical protein